jgi:hypothetical protein
VAPGSVAGPVGERAPAPGEGRSVARGRRGSIGMVGRGLASRSEKRPDDQLEREPGRIPLGLQKLPRRLVTTVLSKLPLDRLGVRWQSLLVLSFGSPVILQFLSVLLTSSSDRVSRGLASLG